MTKQEYVEHIKQTVKLFKNEHLDFYFSGDIRAANAMNYMIRLVNGDPDVLDLHWPHPLMLRDYKLLIGFDFLMYTFVYENQGLFFDWSQKFSDEKVGCFEIEWKEGGKSIASTYVDRIGVKMISPCNWVAPGSVHEVVKNGNIKSYKRLA